MDDCSTDDTAIVVGSYADERVRLLRLPENRGVCAARNAGVMAARGEWLLMLDSDDELLPDALSTIVERLSQTSPSVGRAVFAYQLDTGGTSPTPALRVGTWDFAAYLSWLGATIRAGGSTDFFNVLRRSAALEVRYPETRALEASFHVEFARRFATLTSPEVVAVVHSDAPDRSLARVRERPGDYAADSARAFEQLLALHGASIRAHSPEAYAYFLWATSNAWLLTGRRLRGAQLALRSLQLRPARAKVWVAVALGLISPRLLSFARRLQD